MATVEAFPSYINFQNGGEHKSNAGFITAFSNFKDKEYDTLWAKNCFKLPKNYVLNDIKLVFQSKYKNLSGYWNPRSTPKAGFKKFGYCNNWDGNYTGNLPSTTLSFNNDANASITSDYSSISANKSFFDSGNVLNKNNINNGLYAKIYCRHPGNQNTDIYVKNLKIVIDYTELYTVSFNGNGGTSSIIIQTSGGEAIILPTPTEGSEKFLGWFTALSGGTYVGKGGDRFTPSGDITLYAHWEAAKQPPKIGSVQMTYGNSQISALNKVIASQSFLIAVDVT